MTERKGVLLHVRNLSILLYLAFILFEANNTMCHEAGWELRCVAASQH